MWRRNVLPCIALAAFVFTFANSIYAGTGSANGSTASLEATSDLDRLYAAVKSPEAEVAALGKLAELREDRVRTVQVAELINGNDERSQVLEESMMAHAEGILELQRTLSTHRQILSVLRKKALGINQIVALHVVNDGTIDLFCK